PGTPVHLLTPSMTPPQVPPSRSPTMLVLTIYILTFAVGFPANVFTFTTLVCKTRRRRPSPGDVLLLNLTAADLLLLLFLPFKMAEAAAGMAWPLPVALCPVANFCFYS
ncbi:FFAR3 protein, partial [Furnarius figulus]|nr:FFAR3 protein [Furnarius figulus]